MLYSQESDEIFCLWPVEHFVPDSQKSECRVLGGYDLISEHVMQHNGFDPCLKKYKLTFQQKELRVEVKRTKSLRRLQSDGFKPNAI